MSRLWKYHVKKLRLRFDPFFRRFNKLLDRSEAYHLAEAARSQSNFACFSYFYGELDHASFLCLLDQVKPQVGEHFLDLGAGAGLPVLWAATDNMFSSVIGIESVPSLVKLSKQHADVYSVLMQHHRRNHSKISLQQANFLKSTWPKADVILLNATCFIGEMWDEIKIRLNQLAAGTRLIVISKKLDHGQNYKLIHQQQYPMSWGFAVARIYLKIS